MFVKADIEHATKRKSDGSPTVSIKGLPVGSRLRIDGPNPNDQPVYFTRITSCLPDQPVIWECSFPRKDKSTGEDGNVVETNGEKASQTVCGNNCSCNYQSLYNLAQSYWESSTTQNTAKTSAKKKRRKQEARTAKKKTMDGEGPPDDARTLDVFKRGERFYRELCAEKDAEIHALEKELEGGCVALKQEVDDKQAVIDHLRAELVRRLESVAVHNVSDMPLDPDGVLCGGEPNQGGSACSDDSSTEGTKADTNATAGTKKPPRSAKKKRGSMTPERRLHSEAQQQYRAKLEERCVSLSVPIMPGFAVTAFREFLSDFFAYLS